MKTKRALMLLCAWFPSLTLSLSVNATLLWYDGFEIGTGPGQYTASVLAGQSGGTGTFFTGLWIQPASEDTWVFTNSLSMAGQIQPSVGGSLSDNQEFGCCFLSRSGRLFTTAWSGSTKSDATFYIGFLANFGTSQNGEPQFRALEMWNGGFVDSENRNLMLGYNSFDPSMGTNLSLFVKDSETGTSVIKQLNEHLTFSADGRTHFLVLKFELSSLSFPGVDAVSVFLDPLGTNEPAIPSAKIFAADFGSSGLDLTLDRMGTISQFSFTGVETAAVFDELRVGTRFADVAALAPPLISTNLSIKWFTTDGGGGTSTNGTLTVRGTIGQPDAGRLTNGPSALNGGFWGVIAAVQTPGAPLLTITLNSQLSTINVSWPSPSTGFDLQQNTNSVASVNWSNVIAAPTDDGSTKTLIVNPPTGNRFYRLFKP